MAESSASTSPATLFLVSTPIGNLDDFSARAKKILDSVELIYAEDTRTFKKLASRYEISTQVRSYHEHNEQQRSKEIVEALEAGKSIALVSDAGTPSINDPGFRIVRACRDAGMPVSPVPGPCAVIAALSASGFETDSFTFRGFIPVKSGKRRTFLEECLSLNHTVLLYESPHRILKSLAAIEEIEPEREVCVARELTKLYEEFVFGTVHEVCKTLSERQSIKGEIVLLIRKRPKKRRVHD